MPNKVQQKMMDQAPWMRELRQRVRGDACPKCGAEPGRKCIGVRGAPRYRNHKERWQLLPDCPPILKEKPMTQYDDDADRFGDEPDNDDGIRCRRCSKEGLYWQKVIGSDGGERSVLYDAENSRRHLCSFLSVDVFDEVPE